MKSLADASIDSISSPTSEADFRAVKAVGTCMNTFLTTSLGVAMHLVSSFEGLPSVQISGNLLIESRELGMRPVKASAG